MLFGTMKKTEYTCRTMLNFKYYMYVFQHFFDMCSHCHLKEDRIVAFNLKKSLNTEDWKESVS